MKQNQSWRRDPRKGRQFFLVSLINHILSLFSFLVQFFLMAYNTSPLQYQRSFRIETEIDLRESTFLRCHITWKTPAFLGNHTGRWDLSAFPFFFCLCMGPQHAFNECVCSAAQSCPTLCEPVHRSPPGSSARGISPARILEWVAIAISRGYSRPRDQTHVSCVSCIGRRFFTTVPPGKPMSVCSGWISCPSSFCYFSF